MQKLNPDYYVPYFDQILLVFYWLPNDMRVGLFIPRENGAYHGAYNSMDMPDSAIILAQCRVNRLFVRTFELSQDNQEQMDEFVRYAFTHPPRYAPPNESRTETIPHQEQDLEQDTEQDPEHKHIGGNNA